MGWQETERGHTGMARVMYKVGVYSVFEEGIDWGSVRIGRTPISVGSNGSQRKKDQETKTEMRRNQDE